jgi:hypothetical protein
MFCLDHGEEILVTLATISLGKAPSLERSTRRLTLKLYLTVRCTGYYCDGSAFSFSTMKQSMLESHSVFSASPLLRRPVRLTLPHAKTPS